MKSTLSILLEIEETAFTWVLNNYPMIGTVMLIAFMVGWLTWRIMRWLNYVDKRFTKVETDITKIETDMVGMKTTQIQFDKRLGRVEKRLGRVEKKMDVLIAMFKATHPTVANK